jgi:hypothetical protein
VGARKRLVRLFSLYGPTKAFFDKSWQLPDIALMTHRHSFTRKAPVDLKTLDEKY